MVRTPRVWMLVVVAVALTSCSSVPAATTITTVTTTTAAPTTTTTTTPPPEPAYVPPECAGGPVTTTSPALTTTTTEPPAALTATEQNDVLAALDSTVRDQYVYDDFNGFDWEGGVAGLSAEVAAGIDTDRFYRRIADLIAGLGDEHSYFDTPADRAAEDAAVAATAHYVGIGVLALPVDSAGVVTVLSVFPGSAADHAGIRRHDDILTIDGVSLAGDPAQSGQRLRGPECSLVVLTVQTPGEPERVVSAVRFALTGGVPIDARLVPTADGRKIGYIYIPTLFDSTEDDQVRAALEAWGPLDGLILDVREDGGGLGEVLSSLLSLFVSGTVGDFVSSDGTRPLEIAADGVARSQTVPLVVAAGHGTESFAEVLAGVLQSTGRATVLGEVTTGNVETLHGYDLPDGSQLWLAHERFYPRDEPDADWERDGIIPDVLVPSAWWESTFETDPVIARAVEVLAGG